METNLPENIFPISYPPTKEQANNECRVLFYAKGFGWYSGIFTRPHMDDTTHWTYLPDDPVAADPKVECEKHFQQWIATFPKEMGGIAQEFMRCAFNEGWRRRLL